MEQVAATQITIELEEQMNQILFIDDNKPNNVFSGIVIEEEGLKLAPVAFEDAEEALEYLQSCHDGTSGVRFPDYIVLDLNMPRIHGFSFVQLYEERFKDDHPDTRLYIMSTVKRDEDEQRALDFPSVFGFYEKPFSPEIAKDIMSMDEEDADAESDAVSGSNTDSSKVASSKDESPGTEDTEERNTDSDRPRF